MIPAGTTILIPGIIAAFVGVSELRSEKASVDKVRNLIPIGFALALVAVYFLLDGVIPITWSYLPLLSYSMAFLAALVALSGTLVRYSHKLNAILIALVGLILALYWVFLSLPRA